MTVENLMLTEADRLMDRTIKALPDYHLVGIDPDATYVLLRRDGLVAVAEEEDEDFDDEDFDDERDEDFDDEEDGDEDE